MEPKPPVWLTIGVAVVICGVAFAIVKYQERRAAQSASTRASRNGRSFWFLVFCAVVMVLGFATVVFRPGNHRPGVDDNSQKWMLAIATLAFGALVAFYVGLKWLMARQEARRKQFREVAAPELVNPEPPHSPATPPPPPLKWYTALMLVGLVVLMIVGGQRLGDALHGVHPGLVLAAPAIGIGGVVLAILGLLWVSTAHQLRLSRKAFELANDGDVDSGIALLEAERRRRNDPSYLLNDLSVLYSQKKDWARALELIDAQIALTPQFPHVYSNRGLYLLRMGRLEDAEQAFRAAGPSLGDDPIFLCNYAELLIELGRPNDAAQMVAQAQSVLDVSRYVSHQDRQVRADEIYRLRMRLPPR